MLESVHFVLAHGATFHGSALDALDRVLQAPAFDLFLFSIVERVAGVVSVEAIGIADEVRRPVTTPRTLVWKYSSSSSMATSSVMESS